MNIREWNTDKGIIRVSLSDCRPSSACLIKPDRSGYVLGEETFIKGSIESAGIPVKSYQGLDTTSAFVMFLLPRDFRI